jgi:hypothetical protein
VAVLVTVLAVAPSVDSPRALGRDLVDESFSFYTRECATGGFLAKQEEYCTQMLERRDSARDIVDARFAELLAGFLAAFAWGAALTAHPIVVGRTWRDSTRVRPPWRVRELEVHFAAAYLLAAGLGAWLLAPGDSTAELYVRSAGVFAGTLGTLLLMTQGAGLLAWLLTRRPTPGWYRAFLVIGAVLFTPVAFALLFLSGVLDMALHPRRRAAAPPAG